MVRLIGNFWVLSNDKLTHPWDANSYLITGDQPVLIDCGSAEGFPALKRDLESFGYKLSDIRAVYATHGHWDHVSGFDQLSEESAAKLFIHQADARQVETGDPDRTAAFLYDRPFPPLRVDGFLSDGDRLYLGGYTFKVIHTPGHTPGSVCFWTEINSLKVLIAGDTFWGGYHQRIGSNMDDWCASLDRLLELDFDVMTTGHAPATLIFDAKRKAMEAREQLGQYFNPWFKPFHRTFRY
jgi:hydroxyacylglutathione hydrolase